MTQVQLNYHANKEQARHNLATEMQEQAKLQETIRHDVKTESIDAKNAKSNWKTAKANAKNAKSNAKNAKANAKNAATNAKNAATNARNADINQQNANTQAKNADTQARLADANINKIGHEIDSIDANTSLTKTKKSNYILELLAKSGKIGQTISAAVLFGKLAEKGILSDTIINAYDEMMQIYNDMSSGKYREDSRVYANKQKQVKEDKSILNKWLKKSGWRIVEDKSLTGSNIRLEKIPKRSGKGGKY